jgi:lipid A 3-O-deacylase
MRKYSRALLIVSAASFILAFLPTANAASLAPTSAFVQDGVGDQQTQAYVAGVTWDLPWQKSFEAGTLGVYGEVAIGRWHTDGRNNATAWPTQITLSPAFRLNPSIAPTWFVEAGVGPSYIVPLFKAGHKRFSTEFNFDDHLAVGKTFGRSEVSVRLEHFSNAGISHPNPGEDFVQIRYAYRLF